MWLKNSEGRYITANTAFLKSTGKAQLQDILGKTDFEIWPRGMAEKFYTEDRTIMATGEAKYKEEYVQHNGKHLWVEVYKKPILGQDGTVLGTVGFARDITERRQVQDALQQSEERLRLATRVSMTGIFNHDHLTDTVYWSPELRVIFGYGADDDVSFQAFVDLLHPDDRERVGAMIRHAHDPANQDDAFAFEFRIRRKDGVIRWLSTRSQSFFKQEGVERRLVRTTGAVVDITERKNADHALRESQERLALATQSAGVGVWEWNLENGELVWDDSMFVLYGVHREEVLGAVEVWNNCVHPDDRARVEAETQVVVLNKTPLETEFRVTRGDGNTRHFKAQGVVICDEQGRAQRVVGTNWDITERIQAVNELSMHANILKNLYEGVYLVRATDGVIVYTNPAFDRMFGYDTGELIGQHVSTLNAPTRRSPQDTAAKIIQQLNEMGVWHGEILSRRKDGSIFWSHATAKTHHYPDVGAVWISVHQDITERKQSEESMRMAASIYQSSSEAIMVTDESNRIVDVNPAFTEITGYTLAEVAGKDPKALKSGRHDQQFYQEMWRSILNEGHWQGEIWDRRKNGQVYAKWATISVIRNPDASVYRYIAQFSDITEKKQKDELIWTQANYDVLTKLPNRRLFQDRLEQELRKAYRAGASLALLLIDLDRFKEINDTLGHAKGDLLLVEAGRRICGCVRETDTVARLGGDEFTVILPEVTEAAQIERIAQNIIRELSKPFLLGERDLGYISATIGITLYPEDAGDMVNLLKHADQAMYRAKAEGRSRFGYFTPSMQREAQDKRTLTDDLRRALAQNELEVYYQPIVDLATGKIVKAEALLRWKHPQRGLIYPATFIPLAEDSGLILEIGEWVFHQANACVERLRTRLGRIIQVSVNKSPKQFEYPPRKDWSDMLLNAGLPGNSVTVEITEGLLLKDSPRIKRRLLEFRNNGIEVSIDDFGTGFSSLSYLKRFDVDYLKIDRSFINHLTENESDRTLAEAIIVMAHKLNIETVAEGVETREQRDLLKSFGCDYAQGFLYSPAVPLDEFEKMIEH